MRVLLVNSNRLKQPWPVLPFGLCCVASSVKAAGHDVKVLDLCFSRKPERDMKKALAKRETLRHSNWMLWDEGEGMNTPLALLVATNALLKRFAPNQPIWRLFVVLRRLQMWTGVNAVKRLRHEIKCRKFQREATGNTVPGVRCRVSGV